MQRSVLLSIRPKFAEAILSGSKTFEFRRALFKDPKVRIVVVYASTPVRRVVGEFTIKRVLSMSPAGLWRKTSSGGGIDRSYFDDYFRGADVAHAIEVHMVKRYREPRSLHGDYLVTTPPQSFRYLPVVCSTQAARRGRSKPPARRAAAVRSGLGAAG